MKSCFTLIALLAVIALAAANEYATNGRQMRGSFTSPLPATVNFNIPEIDGIGGCIYLGSASGNNPQVGGLYMRVAQCNDTSLTALIASSCGVGASTQPFSNMTYTVGTTYEGNFFTSFNGVTYTEFSLECYDPTPDQILPPEPGAVPPSTPVPAPRAPIVSVPAMGPNGSPNAASLAAPSALLFVLVALIGVLASLL